MADISAVRPVSYLRDEYKRQKALFDAQPSRVQRFVEAEAQQLAESLMENTRRVHFAFPGWVAAEVPQSGELTPLLVPVGAREQAIGGWRWPSNRLDLRDQLRLRFIELEQSPDQAIHICAGLMRFATASHMVYNMLPAGRSVFYQADGDEQIPSQPVKSIWEMRSALTMAGDAIAEENPAEGGRGELHSPYVQAAQRFYLPRWVVFDDQEQLLVNSVNEAEAHLASMERFVEILHAASSLAPYMLADETYQLKRYGILGQVVNQGRALARYKARQIIHAIQARAQNGTLNRGLSISLPYYDDQELHTFTVNMEIIPAGRIGFKPFFVIRAARLEHTQVAQNPRLNASTRKYLLHQLDMLEQAFTGFTNYR